MFGVTRRQQLLVAVALVVGLAAAVSALAGWGRGALAGLAVLGTAGVVTLLDVRRRLGELDRRIKRGIRVRRDGRSSVVTKTGLTKELAVRERRLLAAIEGTRLDGLDGFTATRKTVEGLSEDMRGVVRQSLQETEEHLRREFGKQTRSQTSEVEAMFQLFGDRDATVPMPASGNFALRATGLLNLVTLIERTSPALVLELGSGTSTVWIATVLRELGSGRVVSIDHLDEYADQTRAELELHGLGDVAEVRCAPLQKVDLEGGPVEWYDPALLEDLRDVDLLLVDGPPKSIGPHARRPAMAALVSRLADGSWVVVDDANRPDEHEMAAEWVDHTPGLVQEFSPVSDQILLRYRPS